MAEKSFSAGAVIIGPNNKVVIVSQPRKVWSLPKGRLEHGEDTRTAARREIEEETGLTQIDFIKELGSYERFKIGKVVTEEDKSVIKHITIFLCTTKQEKLMPIDPDNEIAKWVDIDQVEDLLPTQKDKEFYKSILPEVKEFINSL